MWPWMVHYMQYPPGPNGRSESYRQKLSTQQHFSFYFDELFHDFFAPFSTAFKFPSKKQKKAKAKGSEMDHGEVLLGKNFQVHVTRFIYNFCLYVPHGK